MNWTPELKSGSLYRRNLAYLANQYAGRVEDRPATTVAQELDRDLDQFSHLPASSAPGVEARLAATREATQDLKIYLQAQPRAKAALRLRQMAYVAHRAEAIVAARGLGPGWVGYLMDMALESKFPLCNKLGIHAWMRANDGVSAEDEQGLARFLERAVAAPSVSDFARSVEVPESPETRAAGPDADPRVDVAIRDDVQPGAFSPEARRGGFKLDVLIRDSVPPDGASPDARPGVFQLDVVTRDHARPPRKDDELDVILRENREPPGSWAGAPGNGARPLFHLE